MIEFNINDYVQIRMTQRGRRAYEKHYHALGMSAPGIEEDEDGWSRWQLWNLMSIFGDFCYMGSLPPFHAGIRIETTVSEGQATD